MSMQMSALQINDIKRNIEPKSVAKTRKEQEKQSKKEINRLL